MNEPIVRKISFWRLGLGLLLTLLALKNLDTAAIQPTLLPSNQSQWVGYFGITIAFFLGGLVLIFFGIRKLWRKPPEP
ncbi:MAG TPA: hypothetical protein VGG45_06775 [Terracidiphilus sp.]|jgi:hypothetical protein